MLTMKGRPGRPRKSEEEKRSEVISVRVSERERRIIEENAVGQDLSTFLRQAGMGQQQPGRIPLIDRWTAGQFSRIGNNLNQLVRLIHTGRIPEHLEALLQRMYREIVKLRRRLLGCPDDGSKSSNAELENPT
jgi:mobilization protein NikA